MNKNEKYIDLGIESEEYIPLYDCEQYVQLDDDECFVELGIASTITEDELKSFLK